MLYDFLILRVSWTFGLTGSNFISKIYNQLIDSKIKELTVVNDQFGRPTSISLISKIIYEYINGNIKSGFYNLSNSRIISK